VQTAAAARQRSFMAGDESALAGGLLPPSPVVPPVLGEGDHVVGEVPNVPQEPAAHGPRGPDRQVREGAVERAEPQPRLGRELEGPARAPRAFCVLRERERERGEPR
jgi:hypothetical protein